MWSAASISPDAHWRWAAVVSSTPHVFEMMSYHLRAFRFAMAGHIASSISFGSLSESLCAAAVPRSW